MSEEKPVLYTVGHSVHGVDQFIALLKSNGIQAIGDVRSSPFSKFTPQFNREALERNLKDHGIYYVFLGDQLGARRNEQECYEGNKVIYSKVAETKAFREGLMRLSEGAKKMPVAIMCAEKDPLTCHRTILVAHYGRNCFSEVRHILEDGSIESGLDADRRLLKEYKMEADDFFNPLAQRIKIAYEKRADKIAYEEQEQEEHMDNVQLFTIGFTQKGAKKFFTLLVESGAKRIVDVRLNNVSQLAGFAKRDDLKYFANEICEMDYIHIPDLAPTKEILDAYKKHGGDWAVYEDKFIDLMEKRAIEKSVKPEIVDGGCLLCSEHEPHHCHRRLIAEYLNQKWGGNITVKHLI